MSRWSRGDQLALLSLIVTLVAMVVAAVMDTLNPVIRCFLGLPAEFCGQTPGTEEATQTAPAFEPGRTPQATPSSREQTEILQSPSWQEIPGTYSETFEATAFLEMNGLQRAMSL